MLPETLVLGGGIAGLTAAYVLNQHGEPVHLLESRDRLGGGCRTVRWGDFRFDLGGHRLYTRNPEVLSLVEELLGDDLLRVSRTSRIYLHGHLVNYPLTFFNALKALGPLTSGVVAASYMREKLRGLVRRPQDSTFEDWVVHRFGRKLYEIYFKTYSEKVWGVPCDRLGSEFAAQRIKGLSFREAVKNMLVGGRKVPETLVSEFLYPRYGFGEIPQSIARCLPQESLHRACPVTAVHCRGERIHEVVTRGVDGEQRWEAGSAITTIPVSDLVEMMSPPPPIEVLEAARDLRYRDIVIVFLAVDRNQVTKDHWIYFPDPEVFVGRIHEPKNWSAQMAPPDKTGVVAEAFCFQNAPVWSEPDDSLIRRTAEQLEAVGLIKLDEVIGGRVVRYPKAYPLYERGYRKRVQIVLGFLDRFENLQSAGRNALFCYTSSDRYIEMARKAAENLLGLGDHDLRAVAAQQEYAEK